MNKLLAFVRQPLNQAALAGMAGTALAVLQGSMMWQHAVPVAVGAVVALVIPDNSVAKEDIEQLVADAIKAAADVQAKPK
ncbi:MAG: hypothetical protein M0002_03345 [Rhodospirillales bacterium]|nr:hypothetical protein [Rhodospirillales bacterium]